MVEVHGAYKHVRYEKNLVEKFATKVQLFWGGGGWVEGGGGGGTQDGRPTGQLTGRPNTTHYIDPYVTHMDKKQQQRKPETNRNKGQGGIANDFSAQTSKTIGRCCDGCWSCSQFTSLPPKVCRLPKYP